MFVCELLDVDSEVLDLKTGLTLLFYLQIHRCSVLKQAFLGFALFFLLRKLCCCLPFCPSPPILPFFGASIVSLLFLPNSCHCLVSSDDYQPYVCAFCSMVKCTCDLCTQRMP